MNVVGRNRSRDAIDVCCLQGTFSVRDLRALPRWASHESRESHASERESTGPVSLCQPQWSQSWCQPQWSQSCASRNDHEFRKSLPGSTSPALNSAREMFDLGASRSNDCVCTSSCQLSKTILRQAGPTVRRDQRRRFPEWRKGICFLFKSIAFRSLEVLVCTDIGSGALNHRRPGELTRNSSCQNTGRAKDPPPLCGVLATAAW
jgi:hypothetical protein